MQRIFALLLVIALAIGTVSANEGEPFETGRCYTLNPNGYPLYDIWITPDELTCVYGLPADTRCWDGTPEGYVLSRTIVKPNGRIKCVYINADQRQ